MRSRPARAATSLAIGAVLAVGLPLLDLWRDCHRAPESEACVWGRAYLPISLVLGAVIALVVAAGVYAGLGAWHGSRPRGERDA